VQCLFWTIEAWLILCDAKFTMMYGNIPHSSTGKENNSPHFLVVKEIVEGPQTSFFTVGI
jgi:hypothetical protein